MAGKVTSKIVGKRLKQGEDQGEKVLKLEEGEQRKGAWRYQRESRPLKIQKTHQLV